MWAKNYLKIVVESQRLDPVKKLYSKCGNRVIKYIPNDYAVTFVQAT